MPILGSLSHRRNEPRLLTSAKQRQDPRFEPQRPKMSFEFLFYLNGKSTIAFLMGHSLCILKSWYTGGDLEQGFCHCFADGLNQS